MTSENVRESLYRYKWFTDTHTFMYIYIYIYIYIIHTYIYIENATPPNIHGFMAHLAAGEQCVSKISSRCGL